MSRFKVGDHVSVVDRAWSQGLNIEDEVRASRYKQPGNIVRKFLVIGVNCAIPIQGTSANTLVVAKDTGSIFGINDCNLIAWLDTASIGLQYIANGRNVTSELSTQSKDAVLRAHLS